MSFSELMMSNLSFRIDEVESRPILIIESTPDCVVVIHGDRVADMHVFGSPSNVRSVFLKSELGRMHPDHDESLVFVFLRPGTEVWKRASPINAGVSPKVDQHDFASEAPCCERR